MRAKKTVKNNLSYPQIIKDIFKIALPIAFQMFLVSLLQLVDNLFIGQLEEAEYVAAGVNAINNITYIISTIVTGFLAGVGIYFIQTSQTNNLKQQHDIFKMKFIWMMMFSVVLLTVFFVFLKPIASLWIAKDGDFDKTLDYSFMYGSIILPSLFLDFVGVLFANSFKELKIIKVTVTISVFVIMINSVLNYVLMYYLGWGITGAAYATLIARLLQSVIWIVYVFLTKPVFIPRFRDFFRIRFSKIFFVFHKSFLWMLSGFLISLAFTIKIMVISQISKEAGTSLNSAGVFLQLTQAFMNGFAQAINILVVSFLVRSSREEFSVYVKKNIFISLVFGLGLGLLSLSFLPLYPVLYSNYSGYTIQQSIIMIVAVALTIWTQMILQVWISALKGAGFSKMLLVFDGLFSWTIELPVVLVLYFTMGKTGLSYGWIYAISTFSIVLKPISIWGLYHFNRNKIKPLVLKRIPSSVKITTRKN